jgi:hypothetical protein
MLKIRVKPVKISLSQFLGEGVGRARMTAGSKNSRACVKTDIAMPGLRVDIVNRRILHDNVSRNIGI